VTDQGLSLIAYFLVAFVIVSPFAYVVVRRVLRDRRESRADLEADAGAESNGAASRHADDLATVFEAIDAGGASEADEFEVTVAGRPLVDGMAADPAVVDALLRDAITRSGLRIVTDTAGANGRVLTLRRR
jgi:hypothetical protein